MWEYWKEGRRDPKAWMYDWWQETEAVNEEDDQETDMIEIGKVDAKRDLSRKWTKWNSIVKWV